MTKRIALFLTWLCLSVFLVFPVYAESENGNPVESPEVRIVIDGKAGSYDVSPVMVNGRVLLPLRAIFTNLGVPNDDSHILWNGEEQKVTVYKNTDSIVLKVNSNAAVVNGKNITLDVPAIVYKDRTYVPARFVSQSLGKKVSWDDASKSVIISGESDFNNTKAILEKAFAATDSALQLRNERNVNVSIQYNTIKSVNEANGLYQVDKKKQIVSGKVKTSNNTAGLQSRKSEAELWYEKGTLYARDINGSEWSSTEADEEMHTDMFNAYHLLTQSDAFYGGLKVVSGNNSGDIVLAGDIAMVDTLRNTLQSINVTDLKLKEANTQVVIDKNTYHIKKVIIQFEGSLLVANLETTLRVDAVIANSDFDGNFQLQRPKELDEQIASAPGDYDKGMELLNLGSWEEAIEYFDKAIEADPESAKAYQGKAIAQYRLGEYEDSNESLDKAFELDNKNVDTLVLKARNLVMLGENDKALELCGKALALNSNSDFAYNIKAYALQGEGKYQEALEAVNKSIELDPKYEDAYITKASLLYDMKNYEECIAAAGKAQELFPKNEEFPWYAADCYYKQNKYEEAIKQYEKVLKINPKNDTAYAYMGLQYYYLQNYDKALECAQSALKLNSYNRYAAQVKKMAEEAKQPEAQRVVNFFKTNYLYFDKVKDFDKKSAEFMGKQNVTAEDVKGFIGSLKLNEDVFTYVLSGQYYDEMIKEENTSQVTSRAMENNGHYIRINAFTKTVGADFKKAVDGIQNPESKTLIIDLRENGGGLAEPSNYILDLLLPQCVTSYTVDRDGYIDQNYSDENQIKFKKILILVNENSASSSELLTLGLKKYLNNVVIIGQPTVGKGVGQNVFENKEKKYMIFLVNFYWNVKEQNIAGSKITPDVILQGTTDADFFTEVERQMAK